MVTKFTDLIAVGVEFPGVVAEEGRKEALPVAPHLPKPRLLQPHRLVLRAPDHYRAVTGLRWANQPKGFVFFWKTISV